MVEGGPFVIVPPLTTVEAWADQYGGQRIDGGDKLLLYKAVDKDFMSGRGMSYAPGTTPECSDWDGGVEECGGGLHFCARAVDTLQFFQNAQKFVACPVAIADIAAPKANARYPSKVKARRCCGPVYEVDRRGRRIEQAEKTP